MTSGSRWSPTSLSQSDHPMTNTLRLPPTSRSSLVGSRSWAPANFGRYRCLANASFFAWVVLHGHCWTSDRLHRYGLKVWYQWPLHTRGRNSGPPPRRLCLQSRDMVPCPQAHSSARSRPGPPPEPSSLVVLRPRSWLLNPGGRVSMPSFGWSLGRFGRNVTCAFTIGRCSCRWHLRQQSWTRPRPERVQASFCLPDFLVCNVWGHYNFCF
jgi:hypothetical protein